MRCWPNGITCHVSEEPDNEKRAEKRAAFPDASDRLQCGRRQGKIDKRISFSHTTAVLEKHKE